MYKCQHCGDMSSGHAMGKYMTNEMDVCHTCYQKLAKPGSVVQMKITDHGFMQFSKKGKKPYNKQTEKTMATTNNKPETSGTNPNSKLGGSLKNEIPVAEDGIISEKAYVDSLMQTSGSILSPEARQRRIDSLKAKYRAMVAHLKSIGALR